MFCKKYYFLLVLLLCSLPVCGQGNIFKTGVKKVVVRQRPAVSDKLGYAAVHDNPHRSVLQDLHGLDAVLKGRVRHSLLDWFGKNTEDFYFSLHDSYLPGFEEDWTLALEEYSTQHEGNNFFADMQPVLASLYPGARFTPQYAVSFSDVLEFSRLPSQKGVRLGKAFLNEWNDKNIPAHLPGFAVVRVEGKGNRPKDVLILDIAEEKVYSLFKSQGAAIAREYVYRKQRWARRNEEEALRLQRQGFVLDEKKHQISKDGVFWTDLNSQPNAACFWYVWKNGLKVKFKRGSWAGQVLQPQEDSSPAK